MHGNKRTKIMKPQITILVCLAALMLNSCEDKLETNLTGSLSGVALFKDSYHPVEGVRITTHPYSTAVVTTDDGRFIIDKITVGEYNLITSKTGYKSQSITLSVKHNQATEVEIILEKSISSENIPTFTANFYPPDKQTVNDINITFRWQVTNTNDSINYGFRLFEAGSPNNPMALTNLKDTFLTVNALKFATWYYWQIEATNKSGQVYSEVQQFKTLTFPSNQIMYTNLAEETAHIYVADTLKLLSVKLTSFSHHVWNAKPNHNRTSIAFESAKELSPQLYVMKTDGTSVTRITTSTIGSYFHQNIEYDWAPNGSHLVFTSYDKLYRINPDGTGLTTIATAPEGKHFREVIYNKTGNKLYVLVVGNQAKDRKIYSMNTNGTGMELIYENPSYAISGLSLHPNNNLLLISLDISGFSSDMGRMLDARIHQLNLTTKEITNISIGKSTGTNDLYAKYSPNGGKVIFVNVSNSAGSEPSIWMMNTNGTNRTRLFQNASFPFWYE